MNRVFYNTGIDENASCHYALGSAELDIDGELPDGTIERSSGGAIELTRIDAKKPSER